MQRWAESRANLVGSFLAENGSRRRREDQLVPIRPEGPSAVPLGLPGAHHRGAGVQGLGRSRRACRAPDRELGQVLCRQELDEVQGEAIFASVGWKSVRCSPKKTRSPHVCWTTLRSHATTG